MTFFYSSSASWNVSSNVNRNGQRSSHLSSGQTHTTSDGETIRTASQQNDDPVQFTEYRVPFGGGRWLRRDDSTARLHETHQHGNGPMRSGEWHSGFRRVEDVTGQDNVPTDCPTCSSTDQSSVATRQGFVFEGELGFKEEAHFKQGSSIKEEPGVKKEPFVKKEGDA